MHYFDTIIAEIVVPEKREREREDIKIVYVIMELILLEKLVLFS